MWVPPTGHFSYYCPPNDLSTKNTSYFFFFFFFFFANRKILKFIQLNFFKTRLSVYTNFNFFLVLNPPPPFLLQMVLTLILVFFINPFHLISISRLRKKYRFIQGFYFHLMLKVQGTCCVSFKTRNKHLKKLLTSVKIARNLLGRIGLFQSF